MTVRRVALGAAAVLLGLLVVLGLGFRSDADDGSSPLDGRPAPRCWAARSPSSPSTWPACEAVGWS